MAPSSASKPCQVVGRLVKGRSSPCWYQFGKVKRFLSAREDLNLLFDLISREEEPSRRSGILILDT